MKNKNDLIVEVIKRVNELSVGTKFTLKSLFEFKEWINIEGATQIELNKSFFVLAAKTLALGVSVNGEINNLEDYQYKVTSGQAGWKSEFSFKDIKNLRKAIINTDKIPNGYKFKLDDLLYYEWFNISELEQKRLEENFKQVVNLDILDVKFVDEEMENRLSNKFEKATSIEYIKC